MVIAEIRTILSRNEFYNSNRGSNQNRSGPNGSDHLDTSLYFLLTTFELEYTTENHDERFTSITITIDRVFDFQ